MRLSVDRIENGIAVCYDGNQKKYELPADRLSEGFLIDAEFDGNGNLISVTVLTGETETLRKKMAERTKNLFNRKKN